MKTNLSFSQLAASLSASVMAQTPDSRQASAALVAVTRPDRGNL